MRTLTMKAGCGCRFIQHLVAPATNISPAINLTPSSPIDASLMTSAGQPNHCAVSFFSTTISSPSLNISLSSLENISPSVILTPPRRKKHRTAFPRRGKKFLDIQEALRKADGVPEGAELIFLRRRDWSNKLALSMDVVTVAVGCAFFAQSCPPEYLNECLILKSVSFLLVVLFTQRRMSAFCQRIYLLEPETYFAVFPRYFLPQRVVQYRAGEVTLRRGVFFLPGQKKMHCNRIYFPSDDHIVKMLKLQPPAATE